MFSKFSKAARTPLKPIPCGKHSPHSAVMQVWYVASNFNAESNIVRGFFGDLSNLASVLYVIWCFLRFRCFSSCSNCRISDTVRRMQNPGAKCFSKYASFACSQYVSKMILPPIVRCFNRESYLVCHAFHVRLEGLDCIQQECAIQKTITLFLHLQPDWLHLYYIGDA